MALLKKLAEQQERNVHRKEFCTEYERANHLRSWLYTRVMATFPETQSTLRARLERNAEELELTSLQGKSVSGQRQ